MSELLLRAVGAHVRLLRESRGLSRRILAEQSGLSERFLSQLEGGSGNISLVRFAQVASALATTPAAILAASEPSARPIALLGVRGAGKSTVGHALARELERPFVELDQCIEEAAGLSLAEIFELHGESYYRRVERETLIEQLAASASLVFATGGSIVSHDDNWALIRERTTTIWLKAEAEDHWERVIRQGDRRPMAQNPHAFSELETLLAARAPLYARANIVVDTSAKSVRQVVSDVLISLRSHEPLDVDGIAQE